MESPDTSFSALPGSIFVAVVTIFFLLHRTWPLYHPKIEKSADVIPARALNNLDLIVSKEPDLPDGWSGLDIFELERRALFSQTWMYLAHITQFAKPGAYQSFDLAGFPVFLIRGKDDKIRAFHNVCRHRAYTITRKETGASTVLGCRYHGWSYDTTGRLVKAPQFDDVPGFDKSRNSLFEIHVHTTDQGLVFVNLDSNKPGAFDGDTTFAVNQFATRARLGVNSTWVVGQTLSGDFNWKVGARSRHLNDLATELDCKVSEICRPSLAMKLIRSVMQNSTRKDCRLFPTTVLCSFSNENLSLALSFFPASESKTHIRYDLFAGSNVSESETQELSEVLQTRTQELAAKITSDYQSITKNPGSPYESNSLAAREILSRLQEHMKLERMEGSQIFPATRKPEGSNLFQQAEKLCKEIHWVSGGLQNGTSSAALDW